MKKAIIIFIIIYFIFTLNNEYFGNPSDDGNLLLMEKKIFLDVNKNIKKDPSKLLKSLRISTIPTVTTFSYILLSGIIVYDKNNQVIVNWYDPVIKKNLDATVFSDPRLFKQKNLNNKKTNDAAPSSILVNNLGFNFGLLDNVYKKINDKYKYPEYKPFRLLSNKLIPDKYNFPSIPKDNWYGNHRFFDFLEIRFNKNLQLTIDDIGRIDVIHAIKRKGDDKYKVSDSIYLDKNAYMLSKNNLELINYLDQSLISKKLGESILKFSTSSEKSSLNRLFTKIIITP